MTEKEPEREIKNKYKGDIFLLEEKHENFIAAVRNASGHRGEKKLTGTHTTFPT